MRRIIPELLEFTNGPLREELISLEYTSYKSPQKSQKKYSQDERWNSYNISKTTNIKLKRCLHKLIEITSAIQSKINKMPQPTAQPRPISQPWSIPQQLTIVQPTGQAPIIPTNIIIRPHAFPVTFLAAITKSC
jgi:hypothetical protein